MKCEHFISFFFTILTKITTLEFSVAKRICKASPKLKITPTITLVIKNKYQKAILMIVTPHDFLWR